MRYTPLPVDTVEQFKDETFPMLPYRRVPLVSHNVMHATSDQRLSSILHDYNNALVVALQGTRRPQGDQKTFNCYRRQSFVLYSAGFTKRSGEHAGVIFAFHTRFTSEQHLRYYHIPKDPLLQGRLVGVRRKTRGTDEFHICIYFPPASHPLAQKMLLCCARKLRISSEHCPAERHLCSTLTQTLNLECRVPHEEPSPLSVEVLGIVL